ncbi:putative reverse transcriptase domain-containing protein [Tanacetum coccineum]
MSSASSTVTYTSVDTDSEPRRAFWPVDEELSDGGSPWVILYGYDGLPIQPVAPPSPDYIPGPEDPQAPLVLQDEDEPEEQPLPLVDSPTALSPRYVTDSDPKEDSEEHADYPTDRGDDDDDDDDTDDELMLMTALVADEPVTLYTHLSPQQYSTDCLDISIRTPEAPLDYCVDNGEGEGHLATSLGKIRALQAREQARAGAPEGTASMNNMPAKRNSTTTRTTRAAATAAATVALMTAAAVEQLVADKGHIKRDCPKLKNENRGNQRGNDNASAKVYVVGNAGTNPDSNVVTGMFLLNDRYASILFDTGADRSFVSTTFSSLIDITPTTLDHYYDVELADGKIIRINTIIRGCTLNLLNHPFNINLMPVELGSFDVIVGMDWLAKYHVVIDCAEKIVRIPWGNETLIVHGDGSNQGNGTRLNIISCTKTHKYLLKGHHAFLANITIYKKDTEVQVGSEAT